MTSGLQGFERTSNPVSVHLPSTHSIHERNVTEPTIFGATTTTVPLRSSKTKTKKQPKIKGVFSFTSTYICIGIIVCFVVILQFRYTSTKEQKIAEMGFHNWYFANSAKARSENQISGEKGVSNVGFHLKVKSIGPEFPQSTRLISKLQ